MSIGYIASAVKQGNANGTGNSSDIDTTGANFIAIGVGDYAGGSASTISDTYSNSFSTAVTQDTGGVSCRGRILYAENAAVGSGHHFSASGTSSFASISISTYSGVATSSSLDGTPTSTTSLAASVSTLKPGTQTTSAADVVVYVLTDNAPPSGSATVDVGTPRQQAFLVAGVSFGICIADSIQGGAGAIDPQFSFNATVYAMALMAAFKPAAGGFTAVNRRTFGPRVGSRSAA